MEKYEGPALSGYAANSLIECHKKFESERLLYPTLYILNEYLSSTVVIPLINEF